ncbi:hypothetical protein BGZ54_001318 [Gamsiella multidivaricata]|nr:hypothetical protein BGZ54_001318 [Gamsiella multidivaricata]
MGSNAAKTTSKSIKTEPDLSPSSKKATSATSKSTAPITAPKTFRFEGSISSESYKTTKSFDLAGVNILNRKPLDTRTALDKLQRRRETHNRVERKRRDCINQLIDDLTKLLPPKHLEEVTSKCHRVNVLRGAVAHIKFLADQNLALTKSLDTAKEQGFQVPIDLNPSEASSKGTEGAEPAASTIPATADGSAEDDGMAMDVDTSEPVKREINGDDDDEDIEEDDEDKQIARVEKTSSKSSSPSANTSNSRSASPRLTPSKALAHPPVIVTDASSPSSDKESDRQSKIALVPPPVSILKVPDDVQGSSFRHPHERKSSFSDCASPASSLSASPMFPSSPYIAKSESSTSTFPPSPVSPSPSARQNPFSMTVSQAEGHQSSLSKDQQQKLSPFMQHQPTSASPSLPPISSLANLQLQSPSGAMEISGERLPTDCQTSPSLRSSSNSYSGASSGSSPSSNAKFGSHRSGPTLPPLKIPPQQHLHPSYANGGHPNGNSTSSQTLSPHQSSTSPRHHHRNSDEQPPVSPFMLSPMMSRSPSMGPLSSSSAGTSPYPHWGHEGSDVPPPPHPGHYMPGSLSSHVYPHGYPYPYPYHPSYGYPHPHGPPPPHHPHHPPPHHSAPPQPTSPQPMLARSLQPEPIFIQEEPWNVQRKKSTSGVTNKNQSGSKQSGGSKKGLQEKEEDQLTEEPPMSPSSSVTSSTSYPASPNHRKRSSHNYGEDEDANVKSFSSLSKRAKQQEQTLGADLENNGGDDRTKNGLRPRDSGIVVVVVEADSEAPSPTNVVVVEESKLKESKLKEKKELAVEKDTEMLSSVQERIEDAKDAAQALTTLAQDRE